MDESHQTESVNPDEPVVDLAVLASGTFVASRYEIERLLGTGGFARVYAARDVELGQRIAIKILRSDRITPATLARLRREVSIAREIPRDTLVRVYDLGQDGEHTFLTMELVEGETLRDLTRRGPLAVNEIARLAEPILDALGTLHAAGVVHRDLKPANILLTPGGEVKLADFGLARRWEGGEKVTRTEALVGTLEYVAPEQALGKQLDGRADLYAFGVLLFEMLTGKLPLEAATNLGTVMAHIVTTAPDVRTIRHDVPPWLAELIQRLMEKEPAARPQTATEVLETIRARKRDLGWRWRRSRARVTIYLLFAAAILASGLWMWNAHWSAFDHIESDAKGDLVAIDRGGRVRWANADLAPGRSAVAVNLTGTDAVVVAVPRPTGELLPLEESHKMRVYSAATGEVMRDFTVFSAADRFPLDPMFGPAAMSAIDPDHDGREDVLVTFTHTPYWPSYSVYVDPRTGFSTAILIASGHHRLAGMADIDGDGVDELFFSGPNNRMGWFTGIAAVKLVRPSGPVVRVLSPWIEAGTPDAEYARTSGDSLFWYSLQPRMAVYSCGLSAADSARRVLKFDCGSDWRFELGYDGFLSGTSSTLAPQARMAARAAAYDELRNALRTGTQEAFGDAIRLAHQAREKATVANDANLVEWISTNEAILLARAGRSDEAEAMFDALVRTSDAPSEICWQAGIVFEQQGELERAVRFHRQGIAAGTNGVWKGRVASDHLESLLLVLAQQERWNEARADLVRYEATYPEGHHTLPYLRAFIDWRSGSPLKRALDVNPSQPELFNYTIFEARWAAGVPDATAFLRELNDFRKVKPAPAYLYESLESEILAKMGRSDEAKALAAKALADTAAAAKTEPIARAHVKLVSERALRMR
ncbi:MAG: protein kinase domain-containing protein [Thermoanaerobaculia bacterium]